MKCPFGRLLFLSVDPQQVRRQLAGQLLSPFDVVALRDDMSTDEI